MRFEFATATRIIFGNGEIVQLGSLAARFGKKALVVTNTTEDTNRSLLDEFLSLGIDIPSNLLQHGIEYTIFKVSSEPSLETITSGTSLARENQCSIVISIGGGSAIDTGKSISAMLTNEGDLLDYLEVIGHGKTLVNPSVPFIAVPTTAGTGAEVTRNAVLHSPEHGVKVSLRSPFLLPKLALVDPELTYHLPPAITASTGLDALTQVIEPYLSAMASPITDGLCVEGMRRSASSLKRAYLDGHDHAARDDLAITSLLGGICLANAKLGAVHAFAGVIGGKYPIPHGALCACLLPHVEEANYFALQRRLPGSPIIERFDEIARILTGNPIARGKDGIDWLLDLTASLEIPSLASYNINKLEFDELIQQSLSASSMQGNPIQLTECEMNQILLRCLAAG